MTVVDEEIKTKTGTEIEVERQREAKRREIFYEKRTIFRENGCM